MKTHHKTPQNPKKLYKSNQVHFQIGLVISLALVYFILQLALPKVMALPPDVARSEPDDIIYTIDPPSTREKAPKSEKQPERKKVRLINPVIANEPTASEPKKELFTTTDLPDLDLGTIEYRKDDTPENIPFEIVEFVPVFPGCETLPTNEERKTCMSKSIDKLILKSFKTALAERYGLSGTQKIYTQFKIDAKGKVTDVRVRAPHPALEKEAKRVIGLIPQMLPAKQRDIAVNVIYVKPIIFRIE